MTRLLVFVISFIVRVLRAATRSRANLVIENVALRQQVATLISQRRRPALDNLDRAFWVALRAAWPRWANALVIVKTDTVAKWHRDRFRRHWAMISRQRYPGRPQIEATIRELIREMATDGWGAPRIHGELMKLGFEVSEATVSRYMPHRPADPNQLKRWMVFLRNHKDVITAMDLFTVPTAFFRVLYGFFGHRSQPKTHSTLQCDL